MNDERPAAAMLFSNGVTLIVHRSSFIVLLAIALSIPAGAQTVRITDKPTGLTSGMLYVPVVATEPVERLSCSSTV